jgi:outer membrane receptor for ferrienterochelin and colicin
MLKSNKLSLVILLFLSVFTFDTFAQKATVKGKIIDQDSKLSLPGASVFLQGSSIGASADMDGNYIITGIEPGKYNLIFRFIGFDTDTMKDVTLSAGEVKMINKNMKESSLQLDEVTVSESRTTRTETAVLMEMKQSLQVVSGISSQQIEKSQDRDASQVVKRIPGVTIVGGSYINIRGLSERYNTVMMHNAFAPSMEADRKSFSFDIIPSSQIDRILIYKSPSAELPGEFGGGVVKIFTKSIPDSNFFDISYTTSYRNGTTFQNFMHQDLGKNSWLGFNNGNQDLPSNFPTDIRRIRDPEELSEVGRSLPNTWLADEYMALPDQRVSFSMGRKFKFRDMQVGTINAINYSNSRQYFQVRRSDFNTYDNVLDRKSVLYDYDDDMFNVSRRLGVMSNWAVNINNNNSIEFKNLFNQNGGSQYVRRQGENYDFSYFPYTHSFDQVYRGLYSGQLTGKHVISENTSVDWVGGLGWSFREQPDYRRYRSDIDTNTGDKTLYIPTGAAISDFLGRFYSTMTETSYTASANLKQKLKIKNFSPTLATGFFFEDKQREFSARNIGYAKPSNNFNNDLLDLPIDQLFQPENINLTDGIRIDEQTNRSDSYFSENRNLAGYASLDLPLTSKLRLVTGLRVENNRQTLNSADDFGPVVVNNPVLNILPSATATYNLSERFLLRGVYGITVNRPEFRELAPFAFYDFNFNFTNKGNPTLLTPVIHNYDFRAEFYPNYRELISVAVFYKQFYNSIETYFVPGAGSGGAKTFTYRNAQEAYSRGIEVEIRKSFMNLTNSLIVDNLSLMVNAAIIESRVSLGADGIGQSDNRPLIGQAPYIVNGGLFYNDEKRKMQLSAMYNVIGRRVVIVGYDEYPDIYEMPRNSLDFSISKYLTKTVEIKAGVADVLNQDVMFLQDGNQDGVFDRNKDQVIQRYKPGAVYSIGFTFHL